MATATQQARRPPLTIVKPEESPYRSSIIFGSPGIGKTHLLGTAQDDERTSPMLLIDVEGGTDTLIGLDIDVVKIGLGDWNAYDDLLDFLARSDHGYKSLAIDSISEIHRLYLDFLRENRPEGTKKIDDINDQQEYGQALNVVNVLMRRFRNLPMHTFFSSHAAEGRDPRAGTVTKLSMAGKAADQVPGVVGLTAYLTTEVPPEDDPEYVGKGIQVRSLVLYGDPKIRTKIRTPWMDDDTPAVIYNPTIGKLFDALKVK